MWAGRDGRVKQLLKLVLMALPLSMLPRHISRLGARA